MTASKLDGIRNALKAFLEGLSKSPYLGATERHWVLNRSGGHTEPKLSLHTLIANHDKLATQLEPQVKEWLTEHYPAHLGLVGTSLGRASLQPGMVLWKVASEAYERFSTFAVSTEQLDSLVNDVEAFLQSNEIRFNVFAVALNIAGPADLPPISFPGNITLRPITDSELTQFYGGNPFYQHQRTPTVFPEFVFVTELKLPKLVGQTEPPTETPLDKIYDDLDRCLLALASYKEAGGVGYEGIRLVPSNLALGGASGISFFWRSQYVPFGRYNLEPQDVAPLREHAKLFKNIDSTLEIACQRLVDAGQRAKPRDAIMDAIIGLESILLTGNSNELSYRFAMNYSTLVAANRRDAFNLAKDLYRLRSKIAHGTSTASKVKVGGKDMTLHEVATLAKKSLRTAIAAFKATPDKPAYLAPDYWLSLYMR